MKKLVVLLIVGFSLFSFGQKEIKEGIVKSQMIVSKTGEEKQIILDNIVWFKHGKVRLERLPNANDPSKKVVIVDLEKEVIFSYILDSYSDKYRKISFSDEKIMDAEMVKIDEVKDIMGYKCEKYKLVSSDMMEGESHVVYVTKKIKAYSDFLPGKFHDIGYPLQIDIVIGAGENVMKASLKTISIEEKPLLDNLFKMTPPQGYQLLE